MSNPPLIDPNAVVTVILGGGEGTRLFPLTQERAKPAVPLACKYRFVDIPISLSINSGIKRIFLLTQYLSSSLHRHVQQSYQFDHYSPRGFIEILAAQKTRARTTWYQGTADAVRQNLLHFNNVRHRYVLILSGDQLYRMDFRHILGQHIQNNADVTVATIPVQREPAKGFGILHINEQKDIVRFVEKPKEDALLDSLRLGQPTLGQVGGHEGQDLFLASMGIYVFNREVLENSLRDEAKQDFGKDIIPELIGKKKIMAYVHQGYWEDIGTIRAYYDANMDLTEAIPKFNFYDFSSPIYSRARYLPASKINASHITRAVIGDGCIINDATIHCSLIGIRSRIDTGVEIRNTILMGSDYYEDQEERENNRRLNRPDIGVGPNSKIEGAIIDKNARIGRDVVIAPKPKGTDGEYPMFFVRDGIVVIPKGMVIPDGTVI